MCEISQGRGYCVFIKRFDALLNWPTHSLYRQISIIVYLCETPVSQPVSHQNHFILFLSHALNAEGGEKAGGPLTRSALPSQ